MHDIIIDKITIGHNHPPFIIGEISGNHNRSLERVLKIVDEAKKAGVHAIKLQTYTPDTITFKNDDYIIDDKNSLWVGKTLYDLYNEAYLPWEWHQPIFEHCRQVGLIAFSTPFDDTAVDFLETLNVPCYKIGSLEIINIPLLQKVASTKKPIILSTGASTFAEISEAVDIVRKAGCQDLILLKCTSAYPAKPQDAHLQTLTYLQNTFDTIVGISDHTLSLGVPLAGIALGARVIEKHITLSRKDPGVDSAFSLEPHELQELVKESLNAWEALGEIHDGPLPSEKVSLSHRPSLHFVMDLEEGEIVTAAHIKPLRPDLGLSPKEWDNVIGRKVKRPIKKGLPVSWEILL